MSELKVDKVSPRSGNYVSLNTVGMKNIIINGDMSIAQRGTSQASITASGYYTIDRFQTILGSLGTWTQSQSTDVPTGQGFATSLKMDCTTADASPSAGDILFITQKFEGQNLQYLKKGTASAVPLTLSFWVKSTKTGTFIAELSDSDNTRAISKSYTVDVTNTWEKKTITFEGDTTGAFDNDNADSLTLIFWLGSGTTYTSGTLQTTWGSRVNANRAVGQVNIADSTSNDWYITGVQLEAGTTASDFEFLPVDVNLGRCQRYFQKFTTETITPFASGTLATTVLFYGYLKYKKTMRDDPSLSTTGSFEVRSAGTLTASSIAISGTSAKTDVVGVQCTTSTGTAGQGAVLRSTSGGGSLSLDSEL
jgi:hypothetical protein